MLAGSVMTAFRKVEPALNSVTWLRSMMEAKRPAWGKRGALGNHGGHAECQGCGDQVRLAGNPARVTDHIQTVILIGVEHGPHGVGDA